MDVLFNFDDIPPYNVHNAPMDLYILSEVTLFGVKDQASLLLIFSFIF